MNRPFFISLFFLSLFIAVSASAEERSGTVSTADPEITFERLNTILAEITDEYEKKATAIEARIKALEEAREEEELEALLRDAETMKTGRTQEEIAINRVFRGSERQQPQMNPEISMTGDFFGSYTTSNVPAIVDPGDFTNGRNQFYLREAEFHIISALDPYTRGKFFFGVPGSGDESLSEMIGEAYMEWLNFPGGMNLKVGFFNSQFGILNRWHDHGLPQVDRPRALNNLFATESLAGLGISANILLPQLWAHVNELDIEVITGGDDYCFDGASDTVIGIAHLKNYYDINRNTYLEVGLSGAYGYNDEEHLNSTTLAGIDLTCKWVPSGRSHYRTIEFRNEFFLSHREEANDTLNSFGFYSYINNKMGARSWIGLRFSYSEIPVLKDDYEWDISPTFDFWQSEFVMMRLQYSYTERSYEENDHSVFLQTVWSMGPHKHEAY